MRDTARTTFSYTKTHGLDSVLWRVVTNRIWAYGVKVNSLNRSHLENLSAKARK